VQIGGFAHFSGFGSVFSYVFSEEYILIQKPEAVAIHLQKKQVIRKMVNLFRLRLLKSKKIEYF